MTNNQKQHKLSLKKPYFDLIKSGKKTIELRLYDEKRQQINPEDIIVFQNGDNFIRCKVKGLIRAKNFATLFEIIDIKKAGFVSTKNALEILQKFYDTETQNKFGVVGIILETQNTK